MKNPKIYQPIGLIDIGFWNRFAKLKVEQIRLDESVLPLSALASLSSSLDRQAHLSLSLHSFQKQEVNKKGALQFMVGGSLKCFNIEQDYKEHTDQSISESYKKQILQRLDQQTPDLTHFDLVMFADLKKYIFTYKFVTNALKVTGLKTLQWSILKAAKVNLAGLDLAIKQELRSEISNFFLLKSEKQEFKRVKASQFGKIQSAQYFFCVFDLTNNPDYVSLPIFNYVAYLVRFAQKASLKSVNLIILKDYFIHQFERPFQFQRSVLWQLDVSEAKVLDELMVNSYKQLKIDLKPLMDQLTIAKDAIDLNIKLMKWRLLPQLDIQKVASTKCLLFGSGTLGCQLARNLIGWGIKKITFIDYSKVSYSNPVRQSLYDYEDTIGGGKPKAQTAAAKLKKIFPLIQSEGYSVSVPMPGHFITTQKDIQEMLKNLEFIEKLVSEHDAIFLLMDSRQARWLPTLLANKFKKICITVALGFDSYLVIRHGISPLIHNPQKHEERLACYFCNDVIAPSNTLKDRTLDQMCTVTRPGLSFVSSAVASQLLISILHHPQREGCPSNQDRSKIPETPLGKVPHYIRGVMSDFSTNLFYGSAFQHCIACSKFVLDKFLQNREKFMIEVINNPGYIQEVTHLKQMLGDESSCIELEDGVVLIQCNP